MPFNYRLLHGHVTRDTAYMIHDYPMGRQVRCKKRVWIETSDRKGETFGKQRIVYQTTSKQFNILHTSVPDEMKPQNKALATDWNNPNASTYCDMALLYIDEDSGHLMTSLNNWCLMSKEDLVAMAYHISPQFDAAQWETFRAVCNQSRQTYPDWWATSKIVTQELINALEGHPNDGTRERLQPVVAVEPPTFRP